MPLARCAIKSNVACVMTVSKSTAEMAHPPVTRQGIVDESTDRHRPCGEGKK